MASTSGDRGTSPVEVAGIVLMILGAAALTWAAALVTVALAFAVGGAFLLVAGVVLAYLAAVRSGGER